MSHVMAKTMMNALMVALGMDTTGLHDAMCRLRDHLRSISHVLKYRFSHDGFESISHLGYMNRSDGAFHLRRTPFATITRRKPYYRHGGKAGFLDVIYEA